MAGAQDAVERWIEEEAARIQTTAADIVAAFKARRAAAKQGAGNQAYGYLTLIAKNRRNGVSLVWGRLRKIGERYVVTEFPRGRKIHYDLSKVQKRLELHEWERQAFAELEMTAAALRERTERLASVSRAMAAYCKASGTSWRRPDDPDEEADCGADE